MNKWLAAVIALVVSPLASAITLTVYTFVMDRSAAGAKFFPLILIYYSACAVVTLFLGLPVFLVLLRFHRVQAWTAMVAGTFIGGSVALAIGFDTLRPVGVLVMGASGTVAALVFWLVWRSSSPNEQRAAT